MALSASEFLKRHEAGTLRSGNGSTKCEGCGVRLDHDITGIRQIITDRREHKIGYMCDDCYYDRLDDCYNRVEGFE